MRLASTANVAEGQKETALEKRLRQQESVGRLAFSALAGIELGELFDQALSEVSEVLGVELCKVLELMADGDRLLLRAGVGWSEGLVGKATVGSGLESQAGYTLISRQPVVVEDLSRERSFSGPRLLRDHGVTSGVSAVIRAGGRTYGVLGAHTKARRRFDTYETGFVQDVANLLGAAIERRANEGRIESLLAERTIKAEKAERRFEFLSQASAALSASTDPRAIIETTLRLTVPDVADWCFVDVVSERHATVERLATAHANLVGVADHAGEKLMLEPKSSYTFIPEATHGTAKVLRSGTSELLPEVSNALLHDLAGSQGELRTLSSLDLASYLCVPLRVGGRVLGSIGIATRRDRPSYGEDDLLLAEGLAHTTAIALDNARQHEDEEGFLRRLYELVTPEKHSVSSSGENCPETSEFTTSLTTRQTEILTLLAEGNGVNEISQRLYLSRATVRNHVRALLQALGAHSQLEAVARARKFGLIP
ncbi:GAF domain-containing protein [Rubrobacter aplysinae]|uniref:GAF domain-containing protein n=1 Tax=Rubrobacter aplysinae TaxID=909625 RepID=UPI00069D37E2|nr:GAF domain-containing protein [Rubrobacter aplysinae]